MGERQFEQSLSRLEFEGIDEIYRLKNRKSDLQAELDCLSVDQEGNRESLAVLRKVIAELDAKIRQLEARMQPA